MFKRKALALMEDLRQEFGEFDVQYNPSAPRRGSFEVTLLQGDKEGRNFFDIFMALHPQMATCFFCKFLV